MRIHAASASAAILRTLEQSITLSGHTPSPADDAELIVIDQLHPSKLDASNAPRITLGGKATEGEHLAAPLAPRQLIRLLRSRTGNQTRALGNGWQVDYTARTLVNTDGTRSSLTEKECSLLISLAEAFPGAMKHDALLAEVWGMRSEIDTHTLETHIYRLRSKLDALVPRPCDIVTVGGAYKLEMA